MYDQDVVVARLYRACFTIFAPATSAIKSRNYETAEIIAFDVVIEPDSQYFLYGGKHRGSFAVMIE
jgi:hypothetical protein